MLALEGGGLRGLLSLRVLAALEQKLGAHYGRTDFRLCHFFDDIAGTSTGATAAAALARGHRVQEIFACASGVGGELPPQRAISVSAASG